MKAILQVALGGAIGASLRYVIGQLLKPSSIEVFPTHTFVINVLGCLAIGICAASIIKSQYQEYIQLFVITGILGGFTTFSSFSIETIYLLKAQKYGVAFSYMILSLVLGLVASFVGFLIPKWIS